MITNQENEMWQFQVKYHNWKSKWFISEFDACTAMESWINKSYPRDEYLYYWGKIIPVKIGVIS